MFDTGLNHTFPTSNLKTWKILTTFPEDMSHMTWPLFAVPAHGSNPCARLGLPYFSSYVSKERGVILHALFRFESHVCLYPISKLEKSDSPFPEEMAWPM